MALLTKTGIKKIYRRILENGGMTPELEQDIQRLQDDFDERENYLSSYGDVLDGEDMDEYSFTAKTVTEEGDEYKVKYDEMRQRYLDRFFGGVDPKEVDEIKDEQKEDVKEDGEEKEIEDLFKIKEDN